MVRTPCQPGAATDRDQHRAGRYDLLSTPFETFERNIREQLMAVLGPGGFDAKRDIAAIAVNRWAHGYAYDNNPLYDPWNVAPEHRQTGRASWRESVCQTVSISGVAVYIKNKIYNK